MKRLLMILVLLALTAPACRPSPATIAPTSLPTQQPTQPPTSSPLPTSTPEPSETLAPTPTFTHTPTPEPTVGLEKVYQFHGQLLHQIPGSQRSEGAFVAEGGPVYTVAFSPDGTLFVMGGRGKPQADFDEQTGRLFDTVFLFDLTTGLQTWQLSPAKQGSPVINDLVFHPSELYLFGAYQDRSVLNWDLENGERENIYQDHRGVARAVAISPDGTLLASAIDHLVRLWRSTRGWAFGKPGPTLSLQVLDEESRAPFYDLAFSPDNTLLATGTEGYITLWNPLNGQESLTLAGGGISLAFSPDGQTLVATDNTTISIWNVADGTLQYSIPIQATSLDYAPTGDLLAFTNGAEIILWDLQIQREVGRLSAHTDWINVIRFSPDGQFLATGSEDMTAIIWRILK